MDQLNQLMDYTKFHIGVYTTLNSVLVGSIGLNTVPDGPFRYYLFATLACFIIASAFGGLVGSSIPYYKTWDEFASQKLGPWHFKLIPSLWCTHLEHTFFWIGIASAVIGLGTTVW